MKPKRTILCVDEDERAVEAMQIGGIDLVLADLPMPKPEGSQLVDRLKTISPTTPAIVFKGASGACPDGLLADILLSKSNCTSAQLLDHIRMALVRKRGPKPAMANPQVVRQLAC